MRSALGLSVHTGWGVAVVVAGTLECPHILTQARITVLPEPDRFCYHRAAAMPRAAAESWLAERKRVAIEHARSALVPLLSQDVVVAAIVATEGPPGPLERMLASHPRWHAAETLFYRDVFRAALSIDVRLVTPRSLDPSRVGKLAPAPWGRDQKLAALAAWMALKS
jgi:hypothetical protein